MIITTNRTDSTSTLTGQSAEFRIATNAKAFRVLVDGIYADKIGSIVRELLSNSWDAHTRNGNIAEPFEVRLPNPLNPTFSVRDYGCSMTHDFVMGSYSTLFESSKADSNTEVGAFGLGAKAFLAYTDACTLTCWSDGEVRRYLIRLSDEGVPTVHLVTSGASAERQGVEVSFAVAQTDFADFRRAALRCAYGFDTLPRFVGDEVETVEPDFKGDGWRFWMRSPLPNDHRVMARQGCAVYPSRNAQWHVPQSSLMIVDTPIGTANVTASRESLALTSEQVSKFEDRVQSAMTALSACVRHSYHSIESPVKRARFAVENKGLLGQGDFPTSVKLPMSLMKWDAGSLAPYDTFPVTTLPKVLLVHDNGAQVLRRKLRLKALGRIKSVYVSADLATLKVAHRLLELEPHQLITIDRMPDVKINRTTTTVSSGGQTPAPKKVLDTDTVWACSSYASAFAGELQWHRTNDWVGAKSRVSAAGGRLISKIVEEKGNGKPVLFLTEKEAEKAIASGRISANMRIDRVVVDELLRVGTPEVLRNFVLEREVSRAASYQARRPLLERLKIGVMPIDFVIWFDLMAILTPEVVRAAVEAVKPIYDATLAQYPLCFPNSRGDDSNAIATYLDLCDKAQQEGAGHVA